MALVEALEDKLSPVRPNFEVYFVVQALLLLAEGISCPDAMKEAVWVLKPSFNIVFTILRE